MEPSTKRLPPKTETVEYERPSKKLSGKIETKGLVGPFVPKIHFKDERSETLFVPHEEISEMQAKYSQQQLDLHRGKFRESSIQGANEQHLSSPPQENTLSSYGMFALSRAANAPAQYSSKGPQYGQKNSAFQVFNNPPTEESGGNLLGMLLTEVRTQTKLSMEILEKVETHNKMLSILIKDYQLSK